MRSGWMLYVSSIRVSWRKRDPKPLINSLDQNNYDHELYINYVCKLSYILTVDVLHLADTLTVRWLIFPRCNNTIGSFWLFLYLSTWEILVRQPAKGTSPRLVAFFFCADQTNLTLSHVVTARSWLSIFRQYVRTPPATSVSSLCDIF